MGTTSGGIAIQTETKDLQFESLLKGLFNTDFIQTQDFCDHRKPDCFFVAKTERFLIILNSDVVEEIFQNNESENLKKINNYFDNPPFAFAFEEYDSGGTYSYGLIYKGKVKRKFRSVTYENIIDTGELEKIEIKWKNARNQKNDLGDGDYEIIYFDPQNEENICSEAQLPQVILQELMQEKLGFINWTMDKKIIDSGYFQRILRTESLTNENIMSGSNSNNSKWWKWW